MRSSKRFWKRLSVLGVVAASVGAVGMVQPAQAVLVPVDVAVDPDGDAGTDNNLTIGSLNWNTGNALAQNAHAAFENFATGTGPTTFNIFYQAALASFVDTGGAEQSLPAGTEWTMVAGLQQRVVSVDPATGAAQFELVSSGDADFDAAGPNFFEVYFDAAANADDLAGTGFADGSLILALGPTSGDSAFDTQDINGDGVIDADDLVLFDQFGDDNYGGLQSLAGSGETDLTAAVTFADADFFLDPTDLESIATSIFSATQVLPFDLIDPSGMFWDGDSLFAHDLGDINAEPVLSDDAGPDIQFQFNDASQAFQAEQVDPVDGIIPEPMTATLGLLGLGALGIASRRRRTA